MAVPNYPITPIPDSEPFAVPDLWNDAYAEIDENFDDLDGRVEALVSALAGVTKESIGLGDCDNTSDADKPISDATQAALNLKSGTSHTHVVTKAQVGLGNCDNTADVDKPVSDAMLSAFNDMYSMQFFMTTAF